MRKIERIAASMIGLAIFGAVTHVAVMEAGGYLAEEAPMLIGAGVGATAAAHFSGIAWRSGARALAVALLVGMVVAELSNFQRSLEHLAALREERLAPAIATQDARRKAEQRLTDARLAVSRLTDASSELAAALVRQSEVSESVSRAALDRLCGTSCRDANARRLDLASQDVAEARRAIAERRRVADSELAAAEAALAALPKVKEVSVLASWLGADPLALILSRAATTSIGLLVLAGALLHLGARSPVAASNQTRDPEPIDVESETPRECAAAFLCDTVQPAPNAQIPLTDLLSAYHQWCSETGRTPLAETEIGQELSRLFGASRLKVIKRDGILMVVGIAWKQARIAA